MEEIEKKILITIEMNRQEAEAAIDDLTGKVNNLKNAAKGQKQAFDEGKTAIDEYKEAVAKNKAEQSELKTEMDKVRLSILQMNEANKKAKASVEAASGSYDEAQKKLTALGRSIKSAEGGFESTNPKVQEQIKAYRELNDKLKAFDAQMGNHQREVGNYAKALEDVKGQLFGLIPGYDRFASVLETATKAFNAMKGSSSSASQSVSGAGEAAKKAGGSMEGMSASATGMAAAIAAAVAIIAVIIKHFADLTPWADKLAQKLEYLKGLWRGFADGFGTGDNFDQMVKRMRDTANEAERIKVAMQDLSRTFIQDQLDDARESAEIAELQLKMKNTRNTPEQEKAYFDRLQEIAKNKYEGDKEMFGKQYELAVRAAINSSRFTAEEKKNLMDRGTNYAIYLDKLKGLVNGEESIRAIEEAEINLIEAKKESMIIAERAQLRYEKQQDKYRQQQEKNLSDEADAASALRNVEDEKQQSRIRSMMLLKQDFARELSMTDEHFRQMIFKEQEFITKQEELAKKTQSAKAKATYKKAAQTGRDNIAQFTAERNSTIEKMTEDHSEKMLGIIQQYENDKRKMQIDAIVDNEFRELAQLEQDGKEKRDALNRDNKQLVDQYNDLQNELRDAQNPPTEERKKTLKDELDYVQQMLDINKEKAEEITIADQKGRTAIAKKYADERKILEAQAAQVIAERNAAKSPTGENQRALLDAQQRLLTAQYQAEISQKGLTEEAKYLIEQEYITKRQQLTSQYELGRYDNAVKWEQMIQQSATSILSNAISSNYQRNIANMDKAKAAELKNTALTGTQREAIEEKYRKKAGEENVKQFKANQKLQEANAIINLMVGLGRLWVDPGFPAAIPLATFLAAQAALQIGTIAKQKPPAYSTGGLHYESDGLGGYLRGPGTGTSDSMNARLSNGESVINARSTSMFAPLLSAINQAGGGKSFAGGSAVHAPWFVPGFATGGLYNSYSPTNDNGLRQNVPNYFGNDSMRLDPNDIASIGDHIGMNFPYIFVDVKDVNAQQQVMANNKARVVL